MTKAAAVIHTRRWRWRDAVFQFMQGRDQCRQFGADQACSMAQINASLNEDTFLARAGRLLAAANRADRENLVGALREILSAPEGTQINALATFMEKLPDNIGQDAAQVRAWEVLLASALISGWEKTEA